MAKSLFIKPLIRLPALHVLICLLATFFCWLQICQATETSLFFVGEDLSVLTIASRRAETAQDAPAVAQVITREELEKRGVKTLGEALSMLPGFFIAPRERGSQPYLRGNADSILFLYDSVPLTSDSTKSIHPIDEELDINQIDHVEVIRGPGSVLWGPDALTGIVNIVPRQGRDVEGAELYLEGGSPDRKTKLSLSAGKNFGLVEGFLSLSATRQRPLARTFNIVRYLGENGKPLPFEQRFGQGSSDDSKYLEAIFNINYSNWLHLSGRWANGHRYFVVADPESDLSWEGRRKTPFRFIRIEAQKTSGFSSFRANAYYNQLNYEDREVDISWGQRSHVAYGEILYDRELWKSRGLLTLGAGYRYNWLKDAVAAKRFLPGFINSEFQFFPDIEQRDFETSLLSTFAQYQHHFTNMNIWAGVRFDDHSQYRSTFSHTLGLNYKINMEWRLKLVYGTAFRTPYNQQFIGKGNLDPEEIRNLSAELTYKAFDKVTFSVVPFWNKIKNHIQEDPYGGLSKPSTQNIYGVELASSYSPLNWLRIWANATILNHDGPDEFFRRSDTSIILPGQPPIPVFTSWSQPYDSGTKSMFNLGAVLNPLDKLSLAARLQYFRGTKSYYFIRHLRETIQAKSRDVWLLDLAITARDIWPNMDLTFAIKNSLDSDYKFPGTYSSTKAPGFRAYLGLRYHF